MTSLSLLVIYLNLNIISNISKLSFNTLMLNTNLSKKQKLTKQQEFKICFIDISEKISTARDQAHQNSLLSLEGVLLV